VLKLNPRGTPEMIETLIEALRECPNVESVEHTDVSKRDPSHKTGSALVFVKFKKVAASSSLPIVIWTRRKRTPGAARKRESAGYVYLVRAAGGEYKIGKTVNPKSRKKTFDVKLPFRVEYAHVIKTDDMHSLEKALHQQFAAKRLRGSEFFNLAQEDVQFIVSLGTECTYATYLTLVGQRQK
jgi:predicted GIY-YIG superfamily endonuclease